VARLLINLPTNASTSKYAAMLPYPLLLLKLKKPGDILIDGSLICFKTSPEYKEKFVLGFAERAGSDEFDEVIVCCGDYAPDGHYHKWFDLFLHSVAVPVKVCGAYAETAPQMISLFNSKAKILRDNWDLSDVVIPTEMLNQHPSVGGHPKADMRMTVGCPRLCAMCPVPLIHHGKFRYADTDKTIRQILHYYIEGVRFINFVDDNIACGVSKFTKFLQQLREMNLRGMKYHCQEGFEVLPFKDEVFCSELARSKFVDIKVGFENIKEDFLKSIRKYHTKFSDIETATVNIKKYRLDVRMFLLLSPAQTESDIMDNLRFISANQLNVRANILRVYENMSYRCHATQTSMERLVELRALAYGASFFSRTVDVDIFAKDAWKKFLKRGYKFEVLDLKRHKYRIAGKVNFGPQTSRWISGARYLVSEHLGFPVRLRVNAHDCTVEGVVAVAKQQTWF
jgi:hypothetical protein